MAGPVTHVSGFHADALLQAQVAQAAMARLMATAGHDLKQPLHLAVMSIDRALKDGIEGKAAGCLRMATDALRRLGFDLDHLARSSQKLCALEPRYQLVCLENIVSEIEQDWRFYAETCGVELLIRAPSAILETDTRMLATILRNLVGNALKYTSRGGRVSVDVRLERNSARIEVHDTGSGIPNCRMATIFEAFDRAGRDEAADGLGLGPYIVRETARALQYPLTVHSVEGVGSIFTVTVPRMR